ncbi:MAG: hypothetical protein MI799_07950 [Desulfobacterales bacterium]|nr:hypothetical protein [Desulfobacterales bacterium]
MKKLAILFIAVLFVTSLSEAQQISINEGMVTFDAPNEFTPLSQQLIDRKYPSSRAPKYVIGNESGATTIAYDLKPHKIPPERLNEAKQAFTKMFSRMIPGIKWHENKIIDLTGRKWVYMEMTSHAIDTDIYNIMLFTGYKDQMLIFNFNSTKEEFPQYESDLRESLKSIQIK